MNTNATLSPQLLGQAENAHRAMLNAILADTGLTYATWVGLTLIAAGGGGGEQAIVISRMTSALKVDRDTADQAVAALQAAGLVQLDSVDGRLAPTAAGLTGFRQIRQAIDDVIGKAYGEIAAEDLETAGRVLSTVTARINKELAATAVASLVTSSRGGRLPRSADDVRATQPNTPDLDAAREHADA